MSTDPTSPLSPGSAVPSPSVTSQGTGLGTTPEISTPLPEDEDPNEAWKQKVVQSIFAQQDVANKRADDLNRSGSEFLKTGKYVPPVTEDSKKDDKTEPPNPPS